MPNYAATVTLRRARKKIYRPELYNRYEIVSSAGAGYAGEILLPKAAVALASNDTITITVA